MTRETVAECRRQDQAMCEDLMRQYPRLGYALCSRFGVYRGYGLAREEALHQVRQTAIIATREGA